MDPVLNDAESRLSAAAREIARSRVAPVAEEIERAGAVPDGLLRDLAREGYAGVDPDVEVDGPLQVALVGEELAAASAAAGILVAVHAAAGQALAEADPQRWGEIEEELRGGARRIAIVDDARWTDDGRVVAELPLVAGVAGASDLLVVARPDDGASRALLVPVGTDGVDVEEPPSLLGLRGSAAAAVRLDLTPTDAQVWAEGKAADRVVELLRIAGAAVAVGVAAAALDAGLGAVHRRAEAGEPVDRSQTVQWDLADIATETEAARLSTWFAATQAPGSRSAREATASARLLAAEAAARGARRAVQVAGAAGARQGRVERLYRDAKVLELLAGSTEEQLRGIARELLPDLAGA